MRRLRECEIDFWNSLTIIVFEISTLEFLLEDGKITGIHIDEELGREEEVNV